MMDSDHQDEELERDLTDLSALLDGELTPAREAELRARMSEHPELAETFALMSEADGQLRALAGQSVPDAQLARMRAGLDVRLQGEAAEPGGGATVISLPIQRRWLAAAAAAMAAGLALYLSMDGLSMDGAPGSDTAPHSDSIAERPASGSDERAIDPPASAERIVQTSAPAGADSVALVEAPIAAVDPEAVEIAGDPAISGAVGITEAAEVTGGLDAVGSTLALEEPVELLDAASEEEIAIALDYDTLADFDVIAQLELLELLDDLDAVEAM